MSHSVNSVKRLPFFASGLLFMLIIGALLVVTQASVAAASSGDLDPTFGNGGTVTTEFQVRVDSDAYASAVQADGKLLVAGSVSQINSQTDFSVARYNTDGSLDATFGGTGRITANFLGDNIAYAVEVQPDGKILVAGAGNAPMSSIWSFTIVRYMPDGSLDASFGTGGIVTTGIGSSSYVVDLVIQSDSKIVAAGITSTQENDDFAMARYMPDGSLDPSFGTGGIVTTDFANTRDEAAAVALQSDGLIVVVGSANTDFALARYMSDGNPDTSFGAGGKVVSDRGGADIAKAAALTSDGRIVVAGASGTVSVPTFIVARYLANGDPDLVFGNNGYVITNFGTYSSNANAVLLQPDGKIVAGGSATSQCGAPCISEFALARYLDNGDPDTSFDMDGQVKTSIDPQYNYAVARALVRQADGNIVAAGYARSSSGRNYALARYLSDGSLDVAFDGDGKLTTLFYNSNASAYSIALQADGKIIAAGPSASFCSGGSCTPNLFSLARYMPDGVLDPSFGADGKVTASFSRGESQAYGVKVQPDGKIVVAGYAGGGTAGAFALARYMPDGSLDTSFGTGGKVVTDVNDTFRDAAFALAIQADGKIIAAGYSSNGEGVALVRYMSDGGLDTSFGGDGIVRTHVANGDGYALSIALQSDGKIIAGGLTARLCSTTCTNENFLLVRYLPNGDLDTAFGTNGTGGGIVITSFGTSSNDRVYSLALQPDGKIVAAGSVGIDCPDSCSSSDFGLARYLDDGSLDTTFGAGGLVTTDFAGGFDSIAGVVVQSDGKIVGAGRAGTIDYNRSFGLAQYLGDGSLDSSFGAGGKVTTQVTPYGGEINAVVIDPDGKLVVAGEATLKTAGKAFALARYGNDVTCQAGVFTDVPSGSTFYTQITCLANRGIIGGYDDCTFRPGNNITRGQIAKIVSNAAGFDEDPGPQLYEDVPSDSPFYTWINRLSGRGHMGGYQCGLVPEEPCNAPNNLPYFRPNANATRGQLAKIVSNAAGITTTPTGIFFTDVPPDHPFYLWIMRLAERGVMGGYECGGEGEPCDDQNRPYFRPQNNVTRGQASKIVANTFFPDCQVMAR
jgi:uncharacterized delta-60 repeat protein